jgi:DNA polymerase I-like protein with 3'-5' exonuclease and polymerase domains
MGRLYNFAPNECYKAVNALIQGGCADATKKAMVNTYHYGKPFDSALLLNIHDELVFEVPLDISDETVKNIVSLMETAYPYKNLPLTASPEVCMQNLGEKEKYVFSEISL